MNEVDITSLIGWMTGQKRLITSRQEEALRLCHHLFDGHSQQEAAEIMGVKQPVVSELLAKVEKALPQFFPILSKQEAMCYHHLTVDGWLPNDIATHLELSLNAVYLTLRRCKDKGLSFPGPHGKVLRYVPEMDSEVTEKF